MVKTAITSVPRDRKKTTMNIPIKTPALEIFIYDVYFTDSVDKISVGDEDDLSRTAELAPLDLLYNVQRDKTIGMSSVTYYCQKM